MSVINLLLHLWFRSERMKRVRIDGSPAENVRTRDRGLRLQQRFSEHDINKTRKGKATIIYVCIVEVHVTFRNINNIENTCVKQHCVGSRNHCCHGKATPFSLCIFEQHMPPSAI